MILPHIYDVDISQPLLPTVLQPMMVTGDKLANRIGVRLKNGNQDYTPDGSCRGYVLRADGATVPILNGVVSGNVMYIDLPEAAYAVQGAVVISIVCVTSTAVTTVFLGSGSVNRSQTDVVIDPGTVIDDISTLIQAIETAVASIPEDYSTLSSMADALTHIDLTESGYISGTGAEVSNSDYNRTGYIPVDSDSVLILDGFYVGSTSGSAYAYYFYTADKTPISGANGITSRTVVTTIPGTAAYVRFSCRTNQGETPVAYVSNHVVENVAALKADSEMNNMAIRAAAAPNYAGLTFPVAKGDYCWYNGILRKANQDISTAESWTAAHWDTAVIGEDMGEIRGDVADLKSTFNEMADYYTAEYQIDLTETGYHYNISASSGLWAYNVNYESLIEKIPSEEQYIRITANATLPAVYAFLKTNAHEAGTSPNYATGSTRTVIDANTSVTVPIPSDANYIFILKVINGSTNTPASAGLFHYITIPSIDGTLSKSGEAADALTVGEKVSGIMQYNRFNKNATDNVSGKSLVRAYGTLETNASYTTSGFIFIGDIEKVTTSYVHIQCYYDENMAYISGVTNSSYAAYDYSLSVPQNCKYIRVSFKTSYIDSVQVGASVKRSKYIPYGSKLTFDKLLIGDDQIVEGGGIIVAPSGGDYTSLTEAIYENASAKVSITVKAGTYDIVSEYVALFGQETVDALSDETSISGFQFGIRVNDKKILFEPGAHVVCDWTGHTVNSTHRFSAFSVGRNSEIIGLDLDCTATFYAIHDDYGYTDRYYHNIYKDCRIIGHSIVNQNLIGGGCKPYSKHTIENCYFDNGESTGACVRYHNTNISGAEPILFVNNSYFGQGLSFRYYGSQTTKMRAYVNNCRAKYINKGAEGSASVDNVELYSWNNDVD